MRYLNRIKYFLTTAVQSIAKLEPSTFGRIALFCDLMYCRLRFHVSLREYFCLHYYNYKDRYRKNFMLRYHQNHRYRRVNNDFVTQSKYGLYTRLQGLFKREMILLPNCGEEAFLDFVKKHKHVVLKPDTGSLGEGVSTFTYESDEQALQRFREISGEMVCEEFIHQHSELAAVNPYSVNTLRIIAIRHAADDIEIVAATLRSGVQTDSFVDNMSSGGLAAQIDPETGIVTTYGIDRNDKQYAYHPITKKQLIGMNIPNWSIAVDLLKKAHSQLSENPVLGWDIAITEEGADIVEANSAPGPNAFQMADHTPRGEKILKILNNRKNHLYKD